jgi:DNA-binding response OmpR family regulator
MLAVLEAGSPAAPSLLLVEDDPLIADTLLLVFEEAGFEPTWSASADEAISLLSDDFPHVLVTDIHLGKGARPGWDVAKQARRQDPDLPVVFITGDRGHEWHVEGVPKSEIFTKPFSHDRVIEALRKLLAERPR